MKAEELYEATEWLVPMQYAPPDQTGILKGIAKKIVDCGTVGCWAKGYKLKEIESDEPWTTKRVIDACMWVFSHSEAKDKDLPKVNKILSAIQPKEQA